MSRTVARRAEPEDPALREALGVYVMGALDPAEAALVTAHLTGCAGCRAEHAQLLEILPLLAGIPRREALGGSAPAESAAPCPAPIWTFVPPPRAARPLPYPGRAPDADTRTPTTPHGGGLDKESAMNTAATGQVAPPAVSHWPKTSLRVTFGVIWLIDAILKWLPGFRSGYMDQLMGQADGQPGWLRPWFTWWINLQHPHPYLFAYTVAAVETLIALAVIAGFARKLTYTAAIVLSLLIWGTAEGFGGPYTSGSADIGTAVIYALVFAALLLFSYYQGTAPLTADAYLEERISWWHRIAEVGRGHRLIPTRGQNPAAAPTPKITPHTP